MILSASAQKANVGLVCEEPMCSLDIDWPGAECAAHGGATVRAHMARVGDPVSEGVDLHAGLLLFVHGCKPLEENTPALF